MTNWRKIFREFSWVGILLVWLLLGLGCTQKQEVSKEVSRQESDQSPKNQPADASRLSQPFPSVFLKDLSNKVVPADQLLEGKNTVILFISPTCQPCSDEIERWKPYLPSLQPPFQVIGISPEPPAELVLYVKEHQINFPLYSDPAGTLVEYFSLSTYPTLVGVTTQRIVKFIRPGYASDLTPTHYLRAF